MQVNPITQTRLKKKMPKMSKAMMKKLIINKESNLVTKLTLKYTKTSSLLVTNNNNNTLPSTMRTNYNQIVTPKNAPWKIAVTSTPKKKRK